MSQDMIFVTSVATFALLSAFVAYWCGVSRAESVAQERIENLLDELDEACAMIDDMLETSAKARHPSSRNLSVIKDRA